MINEYPGLKVVGTARDGIDGLKKTEQLKPDIITLDVEMPRMDGLSMLEKLMKSFPKPVIMLSNTTQAGAQTTLKALELGAIDFISKPSGSISLDIRKVQQELIEKILEAAQVNKKHFLPCQPSMSDHVQKESVQIDTLHDTKGYKKDKRVVAIGTSTGGPRALQNVLPLLPKDIPAGIVVVQHMPAGFTKSLADRLNHLSAIEVREAHDFDRIEPGVALIAPGDFHMEVIKDRQGELHVKLNQEPPLGGHRPSVNVMMNSISKIPGQSVTGVLLTGMGSDGAQGMENIKNNNGITIAEDESTCVVFGMPRSAIKTGKVDYVVPIDHVALQIMKSLAK